MTGIITNNAIEEDMSHGRIIAAVWQEQAYLFPFLLSALIL